MDLDKITNSIVKKAFEALQTGNKEEWFGQFENEAELFDDGRKMDFNSFFNKALGHERFTEINKVENNGTFVYGRFHSDQWGDFNTYFRFYIGTRGKISKLEIGQWSK